MVARARSCGFTLMEILISLIILSSGVLGIVWAFNRGMFASTDVENVDLALNIAQKRLENIYGTKGGVDNVDPPEPDSDFSDFTVGVLTDDKNPEKVDVTVGWSVKGGPTSITLTTLVADY